MQIVPVGPFDLTEPVGRGGMGVVWKGTHRDTGLPVAVKVLHRSALKDGAAPPTFRNEVRAVAALDHPGVVWVFDVGEVPRAAAVASNGVFEEGSPYLAMEYASGGTLSDYAPRTWEAAKALLLDLLDALGHAHARQVVHRDLKPGNVLLATPSDARPGWKLTDFGIAAALEETVERSIARGIVGTLAYMSPEQIKADWREFGPWTDLYALGCMVYRVVGNQRPFRDTRGPALIAAHLTQRPQKLVPKVPVPHGFAEWVEVLLRKAPQDRFQSAAEAARVLQALGPPVPIPPELQPQPLDGSWPDEPTADSEGPTELVRARSAAGGSRGVPEDWRRSEVPWPAPRLVGAGLGLFGVRTIPMVGRVEERDALWSALRQSVRAGRSKVIVLRGAAGVGKTRVARWVGESAHALAGLPFLLGEARADEPPEQALARPFRRWFRTVRLPEKERDRRLLQALGPDHDELARSLSALLAQGHETVAHPLEGEARHAVARRVLERIGGAGRPAVLVLDDAHHSTDLLRFALHVLDAQAVQATPVVLVLVVAEEGVGGDPHVAEVLAELVAREDVVVTSLHPLPQPEHERLVLAMLPLDPTVAALLARRTAGNPTHAVQVVRDWVADGRLVRGGGGWELAGPEPAVPPMADVWRERIERVLEGLPPAARIVLERAAALGSPVDEDEWQRVCDDPKGTFAAQGRVNFVRENARLRAEVRARLIAGHLAEDTDTGWAFAHEMLRETVLAMASEAGRIGSHHRACARMLLHREDSRRFADRIGRHLLLGDRPEPAIPQLLEAFRQRRRTTGDAAAVPLLGEIETAMRLARTPETDRLWVELAVLRAEVFARSDRWDDARRWAGIADERVRQHADPAGALRALEARAGLVVARALLQRREAEPADAVLARVESLLRDGDDGRLLGEVHTTRSQCARLLGDAPRARAHAVLAAQFLTEAGERTGLADGWSVLGENALREGSLADAERFYERARHLCARVGDAQGEADALSALGEVARARGDLERARTSYVRAVERFREAGSSRGLQAVLGLARVQLARRDWDDARRLASEVVPRADIARQGPLEAEIHAVLAAASAGLRDWASFDVHLEHVRAAVAALHLRDPKVAWCVELAAARADAARERERAQAARRVAS